MELAIKEQKLATEARNDRCTMCLSRIGTAKPELRHSYKLDAWMESRIRGRGKR